ncbi:MAG: hypothetical protein J7M40_11235 [Planctomycetes bacterium]|nr:hypothetical protein [Planctomycetota bacterium]
MISKPKVRVAIVLSVFMGLVFSPVFAERYRPTEEIEEAEAIEAPVAEESLVDSTYNRAAGFCGADKNFSCGVCLLGDSLSGQRGRG